MQKGTVWLSWRGGRFRKRLDIYGPITKGGKARHGGMNEYEGRVCVWRGVSTEREWGSVWVSEQRGVLETVGWVNSACGSDCMRGLGEREWMDGRERAGRGSG